jgi:sirohydrochlorin ferrochelatase
MTETTNTPRTKTPDPVRLKAILDQANAGDPAALPALRKILDEHPDLAAALGDLARHARQSLIALAAGGSPLAWEAIVHQVDALRARLLDEVASVLERLLVERLVVCWVEVHHASVDLTARLQSGTGDDPAARAAVLRLNKANSRFLSATKTLAVVRKLLKPGLTALDFAKVMPEGPGDAVPARLKGRDALVAATN